MREHASVKIGPGILRTSAAAKNYPLRKPNDKWPVWLRLVVILGLSAVLWAVIIAGLFTLFG